MYQSRLERLLRDVAEVPSVGALIASDNFPFIIDPIGCSQRGVRMIDHCVDAIHVFETMGVMRTVKEGPYDYAQVVDTGDVRSKRARRGNRDKRGAFAEPARDGPLREVVITSHVAIVIDAVDEGCDCAGKVNRRRVTLCIQLESMIGYFAAIRALAIAANDFASRINPSCIGEACARNINLRKLKIIVDVVYDHAETVKCAAISLNPPTTRLWELIPLACPLFADGEGTNMKLLNA